jgi:uncharacterized membrane protein
MDRKGTHLQPWRIKKWHAAGRWLLAALYIVAGCAHMLLPRPFLRIMPHWVPAPETVIAATGICEIAGAIGIIIPATRRFAGVMLALYAVCVFPANIQHAIDDLSSGTGLPIWYHGPRLLLQPLIVWWALIAGQVLPLSRRASAHAM